MSITYQIDTAAKLITLDVYDVFDLKEMRDTYEALFDDPDYDADFNTISSFEEAARMEVHYNQAMQFRELIKKYDNRRGKVAIVMGSDKGRFFYGKLAELNFNLVKSNPYKVFKTRDEAHAWLNTD